MDPGVEQDTTVVLQPLIGIATPYRTSLEMHLAIKSWTPGSRVSLHHVSKLHEFTVN